MPGRMHGRSLTSLVKQPDSFIPRKMSSFKTDNHIMHVQSLWRLKRVNNFCVKPLNLTNIVYCTNTNIIQMYQEKYADQLYNKYCIFCVFSITSVQRLNLYARVYSSTPGYTTDNDKCENKKMIKTTWILFKMVPFHMQPFSRQTLFFLHQQNN